MWNRPTTGFPCFPHLTKAKPVTLSWVGLPSSLAQPSNACNSSLLCKVLCPSKVGFLSSLAKLLKLNFHVLYVSRLKLSSCLSKQSYIDTAVFSDEIIMSLWFIAGVILAVVVVIVICCLKDRHNGRVFKQKKNKLRSVDQGRLLEAGSEPSGKLGNAK